MPQFQFAGLSLTTPDSYIDRSVYAVASTNSPGPFQRNLTLLYEPLAGRDLQQLTRDLEQQLLRQRNPTLRLGSKTGLRVSGRDAISIDYATDEMLPTGPIRLVRRIVFVLVGDRALVATFSATEADFVTYAAELEAILASLQV